MDKEKILVSSCLLGNPVRYDGLAQPYGEVLKLKTKYELIAFCPEVEGGLSTPRSPAEIINHKVININGDDVTKEYKKGAELALKLCQSQGITKAILKARSPSCGKDQVYNGQFNNTLVPRPGVAAKLLMENNIYVYNEENLGGL